MNIWEFLDNNGFGLILEAIIIIPIMCTSYVETHQPVSIPCPIESRGK